MPSKVAKNTYLQKLIARYLKQKPVAKVGKLAKLKQMKVKGVLKFPKKV